MVSKLARDPLTWLSLLLLALIFGMPSLAGLFARCFPTIDPPVFSGASFLTLFVSHAGLVFVSSSIAAACGFALGLFATRPIGIQFKPMIQTITAVGLTFPPAAVLALAIPVAGFGPSPTLIALSLYALLPVVENTIIGLQDVSPAVKEAALGMGFSPARSLVRIELPLAAPVILAGIRTAVIINIGTATIGSTAGALTLGTPIIDGLVGQKLPYIIQGTLIVAVFAFLVDAAFERLTAQFTFYLEPNPLPAA